VSIPVLIVDRDGTLIEEPADEQIDSLAKVRFMPGVFAALNELTHHGYQLVMVTNQDGLGSERFPYSAFTEVQEFILAAFHSQGVRFEATFVCPHLPGAHCTCRKPKTGLLDDYFAQHAIDSARSAVVGDRETDLALATNLGLRGFRVRRNGNSAETWPHVTQALLSRQALIVRRTKETQIQVRVNLDEPEPVSAKTGVGFFDHMLEQLATHGGFSLELTAHGDLNVDEHHTVEDSALALGQALREALGSKRGLARYGFLLPMDESEARSVIDLSGRAFATFSGQFARASVGDLPTELVPHFFRSLADALGAAIHVEVCGENTHHMIEATFKSVGRSLRQALRREGMMLPSTKGAL
jgi:imidazoleglycerol-phosphate dehydratase/histidinol-phosphatase